MLTKYRDQNNKIKYQAARYTKYKKLPFLSTKLPGRIYSQTYKCVKTQNKIENELRKCRTWYPLPHNTSKMNTETSNSPI